MPETFQPAPSFSEIKPALDTSSAASNRDHEVGPKILYNTPLTELNPKGLKAGDTIVISANSGDVELEVSRDVTPGIGLGVWVMVGGHRQHEVVDNRIIRAGDAEWLSISTPDNLSTTRMRVESILVKPAK